MPAAPGTYRQHGFSKKRLHVSAGRPLHRNLTFDWEDNGITEGAQWPQGDHSIFLQYGVPAIAVSSKWFIDNISNKDITHTPKDNTEIVNCARIVEIAEALSGLIRKL